jgi:hypothetical protein
MFAAWLPLLWAIAGTPPATPEYAIDARGVLTRLQVGATVFLQDGGVNLMAPGWRGSLGAQQACKADAVRVERTPEASIYQAVLQDERHRTPIRQVVRPIAGGLRVEYELTPEADMPVEVVLLQAGIPLEPHRGSTRYVALGDDVTAGVFPQELKAASYRFLSASDAGWLALVAADGTAVRIKPEGLALAVQDCRKFGGSSYELQAIVPGLQKLTAGKPVRFALELTATTAEQVAQAEKQALATTLNGVGLSSRQPLRAGKTAVDRAQTPVYERVELNPDVAATFDNPFDPDDVALDAEIAAPDGRTLRVPGFYDVPCKLQAVGGRERIRPTGAPPRWTVRFTPTVAGRHRAIVRVRNRGGQAQCAPVEFEAIPSKHPGFVRVASPSRQYFQYDNGQPYFPVGENICWAHSPQPLADYQAWFGGMAAHGGNWARLWLANNEKGLEWMPKPTPRQGSGAYLGLGRYSIENSWRLDQIVRQAEQTGLRLMFCIGTFGEIKNEADYFNANLWESNPYNAANGGPCASPKEFFTHPTARKLYQRRLRYLVARWGYSPNLFAWEFWNEYKAPADWVAAMAAFLKQHDVNRHLVSTTYGNPEVWKNPDVDFTMTHHYGDSGSIADFGSLFEHHTRVQRQFDKPYFIAEFGIDWRTSDACYDPQGRGQNLHNGLWSGVMAGGAATPMLWYWGDYIHGKNVYPVFAPVARFVHEIDWTRHRFRPIDGMKITLHNSEPERFEDLEFSTISSWDNTAAGSYRLGRDGRIEGGLIPGLLGGPHKKELSPSMTLHLDMPSDGQFLVRLGTVSSRARLQIRVDDQVQLDEALRTGPPGEGPWKASRYYPQWKIWQSDYDRDYAVRVPAGNHVVRVANADGDWLSLRGGRVTNYRSSRYPNVFALGIQSSDLALLWLQDKRSTWKAVRDDVALREQVGVRVAIPGMPPGQYRVAWWNTYTGKVFQQTQATATADSLVLEVPSFTRDLAAVIRRLP